MTFEELRVLLETKVEIIELIELINIDKNSDNISLDYFDNVVYRLLNKLFPSLSQSGLTLNLLDTDYQAKITEYEKEHGKNIEITSLKERIEKGIKALDSLNTKNIDILKNIIDRKEYAIIIEIILSKQVRKTLKMQILATILSDYREIVYDLFNHIPKKYQDNIEEYRSNLRKEIKSSLEEHEWFYKEKVKKNISKIINGQEKPWLPGYIMFMSDFDIIDFNNFKLLYNEKEINIMACSYYIGFYNLAKYLAKKYKFDTSSDEFILGIIPAEELIEFIENDKFIATPKKLEVLYERIDDFNKEIVDKIIYTFLLKVTKENSDEILILLNKIKKRIKERLELGRKNS